MLPWKVSPRHAPQCCTACRCSWRHFLRACTDKKMPGQALRKRTSPGATRYNGATARCSSRPATHAAQHERTRCSPLKTVRAWARKKISQAAPCAQSSAPVITVKIGGLPRCQGGHISIQREPTLHSMRAEDNRKDLGDQEKFRSSSPPFECSMPIIAMCYSWRSWRPERPRSTRKSRAQSHPEISQFPSLKVSFR
jgi:hypothetical protein